MILIYPVISLSDAVGHKGSRKNLLGDKPDPELVKRYSNELQVTDKTPPPEALLKGMRLFMRW